MALSIIVPQPVPGLEMANRRAPLADVPNAVNSPIRIGPAGSGKRTRAQAGDGKDAAYGQPPTKKQIVEAPTHHGENLEPVRRTVVLSNTRDRLEEPFTRRNHNAAPTAFEKKLASVREKKPVTQQRTKPVAERVHGDSIESVRQWQKHYRKQFPLFVFYFDGIPDDVRSKAMRQIHSLGAREEKFFSKAVTHVVTTRSIPPETHNAVTDGNLNHESAVPKTIHPAALTNDQRRTTSLLDNQIQRRAQNISTSMQLNLESRKNQIQTTDILSRARALGIKIWALEKLQRVLSTILETDTGDTPLVDPRGQVSTGRHATKPATNIDLEQLLRNEKVNGPADRDITVVPQDMVTLRGCYIYIHDMDERTKPTMAREYSKPSNREDGKWPQFRLTPAGRCPFIEDPTYKKKMQHRDQEVQIKADVSHKSRVAGGAPHIAPPQALAEREPNLRRSPRKLSHGCATGTLNQPVEIPAKGQGSTDMKAPVFGSAQVNLRGLPRMVAGEPVASGMQQSNITSAIRSQAISSAAISSTAPGMHRRVGDTKEVSMLKRKILERGPASYMNDVRAAINDDRGQAPRAAKRKAQESLGIVDENEEQRHGQPVAVLKKKKVEKEPKAGYCENCRDKFEDFDEHILTRKHRKFALTQDNWTELDDLLSHLKRPHKLA